LELRRGNLFAVTSVHRASALAALAALFTGLAPTMAQAQTGRGVVLDSASRQAIPGAVVTFFDANQHQLARTITGQSGTFAFALPTATKVRVVRIGFRPREVDVSRAAARGSLEIVMSALSQLLEPIRVDDDSPCPRRSDSYAAIALWDQARSGLLAAVVARQEMPAIMMNLTYKRPIEGNSDRFRDQEVRIHRGKSASSFRAAPSIAEFERNGFVRRTLEGDHFFGPDAETLLDDAFMRNYCVSLAAANTNRPAMVGVSFTPARRNRDRVDIGGTIWIDTARRALDRVEFRYVGLDPEADRYRAGGELVFQDVRPGIPQIQRWFLRTVVDRTNVLRGPTVGPKRFEVHEDGGELARADWSDGTAWRAPLGAARVQAKSKSGEALVGIALALAGTDYVATTDSTGTAEFTDLLPGPYRVTNIDSALTMLGLGGETDARYVAARNSMTELSVVLPSAAQVIDAECRRTNVWTPNSYALVVQVVNPDGTAVAGARWSVSVGRTTGVTGSTGIFQYCFGLEPGEIVTIQVSRNGERPTMVTRTLSRKLTTVRLVLP
jgi:hypothetical protein